MKLSNLLAATAITVALGSIAGAASAATIVLNFDALNGGANEEPLSYYAGGFGSDGTGPGPNYGITFSANTITGCEAGNACTDTNSAGSPSSPNVIFFLSGGADTMDVAAGFTTGFSFYYSSVNVPALVNVWSGLDGTGTLLATINLPTTPNGASIPGCLGTNFCPYVPIGVTFSGTAESVDFGGTANQVGFDDITLGSAIAGSGTPEPATWAMMLMGAGAIGGALRMARRKTVATVA